MGRNAAGDGFARYKKEDNREREGVATLHKPGVYAQARGENYRRDRALRRLATQIAVQLPEGEGEALKVLRLVQDLLTGFLRGERKMPSRVVRLMRGARGGLGQPEVDPPRDRAR